MAHLSLLAVPCHMIHCYAVPAYVVEETLLFKGNLKFVLKHVCSFFVHSSIVEGLYFSLFYARGRGAQAIPVFNEVYLALHSLF